MRRKTLSRYCAAVAAVFIVGAVIWHHPVGSFAVSRIVSLSSGYTLRFDEMRLQGDHGAFLNARVTKDGEPVLEAARIDIYYRLRDLLPGSRHRFGFVGASVNRPHLTIIHHRDGSYNISGRGGGGAPPTNAKVNQTPLAFYARVRDGSATLINEYQYYREARLVRVHKINADLSVKSDEREHYVVTGALIDQKDQQFRFVGTVDYKRGYALHHLSATAIPLKVIGNYVINSPAARILAGTAKNFQAQVYSLDVRPNSPVHYHLGATATLSDGQLYIQGLSKPLDSMRGNLRIFDGGFATPDIEATIAGVPVRISGGIYNFSNPQFRLGLSGSGDLAQLRGIVAFGAGQPVSGPVRIATLIEGPIAKPLILVRFHSPFTRYGAIPISALRGVFALYNSEAEIIPLRLRYAGVEVAMRGRLALGKHVQSRVALHYAGNADTLPYASAVVPGQELVGDAVLEGQNTAMGANGYFASVPDSRVASGLFQVNSRGVGTIGPVAVATRGGGSLLASYYLDRVHGQSAFWASARHLRLARLATTSLPGVAFPAIPAFGGTIDGAVAGGGPSNDFALGGRIVASGTEVNGVTIGSIGARFAGTPDNLALGEVRVEGSFGSLNGYGTYRAGGVALAGNFDGSLAALSQFTGNVGAHGSVHSAIAVVSQGSSVFVQAHNAQFSGASIRGISMQGFDGTVSLNGKHLNVYSARAQVAGASAVAAGHFALGDPSSALALSTSNLQAAALHSLGVPMSRGNLIVVGALGVRGGAPSFNGGVSVSHGTVSAYPVSGNADLSFAQDALEVRAANLALGKTYGTVNGRVASISSGSAHYSLNANIGGGDVGEAVRTLRLPSFGTSGSFDAQLRIGGRGKAPSISGPVRIAQGSINGLNFSDARANIKADLGGVAAHGGSVQVGSTYATFTALARGGARTVAVRSQHANLADFNDFFDQGDTLAGHGLIDVSIAQSNHRIATRAAINVDDLRYRRLPIGDTDAKISSVKNVVSGDVEIGGSAGLLHASGSIAIVPARTMAETFNGSSYALHTNVRNLDLSTWLPALGYFSVPVTGRVDATASLRGRYPTLEMAANARLVGGTLGRVPVDTLTVAARAMGRRVAVTDLEARVPNLALRGSGSFGLGLRDPIAFSAHGTSENIPALVSEITGRTADIGGTLETDLRVAGTREAPQLMGGFDVAKARIGALDIPRLIASLALRGRNLEVRSAELAFTKGSVFLAGSLPLQVSPFAIGPPDSPLALDFAARAVDLSSFGPLFPKGTRLGGTLDGRIAVSGLARSPQIRGRMTLGRGSFVGPFETVPIGNAGAVISFYQTTAVLDSLHANLGGGSADASGKIAFERGATADQVTYQVNAAIRRASLNFPAYGRGTLDGKVAVTKSSGLPIVSGNIALTDALIPFSALYKPNSGGSGDSGGGGLPFKLAFNLGVTAGKNVRVRGSGLDIGATGRVRLAGTLAAPTLAGRFNSTGGDLTYFDRSFKVQSGYVAFDPANGVIPELHAVGRTHVVNPDPNPQRNPSGAADITINVDGPITQLAISFESNPPGYSREQILGLLTPLGIVSGISYDESGRPTAPGTLRGAPSEGNGQPLPGVLVGRQTGNVTVGQEAFNILNAQFTRGLLAPLEGALGSGLGLSDVNLNLEYGGGFGLNFRRLLARNFYALYGTSFGFPVRQTFGFEYRPNDFTAGQLSFYSQQGIASVFGSARNQISTNQRATAGQPIEGTSGFSFSLLRLFP
ncbi:MAG: translocation/assembly module TamB domain-containing protein [Candidatus Eremiobacteraeota bacterium]|nr:translocation/assembly module TamB domain-containing protein [Candidatus Eremiobacteraeota bacterium]